MPQPYTLTRLQLDAIARVLDAFQREHVHPVSAHIDSYMPLPCALLKEAAELRAWIGHATAGHPRRPIAIDRSGDGGVA